jgi:endonuclease G
MSNFALYTGYMEDFLDNKQLVSFPKIKAAQEKDLLKVDNSTDNVLHYVNYSVQLSASRRFPYFTASNIDGKLFRKAPRKDKWRRDERIDKQFQWGPELYSAAKSNFDKGHMTRREDVQWGDSIAFASLAADSTFFYTNAVPQHAELNQQIWRSLEDYILHTETTEKDLKICVFTGPVLRKADPFFVTEVNGESIQLPTLFWKIVYFRKKKDIKIYRVGFLMSQATLLFENGIARETVPEAVPTEEDKLFMEFDKAETYQVNVGTIEKLTGLTFSNAKEPFKDKRKIPLILQETDIRESLNESADPYAQLGFKIGGLQT